VDDAGIEMINVRTGATQTIIGGDPTAGYPSWSPDGRSIYYTTLCLGADAKPTGCLWRISLDARKRALVTEEVSATSLSPDGRSIAFIHASGDPAIVRADGTHRRVAARRTSSACMYGHPSWSPDSRVVLVKRDYGHLPAQHCCRQELWALNLATLRMHRVQAQTDDVPAAWQPLP
jgi:Tol biopolymer transport system component